MKLAPSLVSLCLAMVLLLACPNEGGSAAGAAELGVLPRAQIQIGIQRIAVEVAETSAQKSQGLSDRHTLPEGHGMWFPYPRPAKLAFWMRNMHFPLDFVWVRRGSIVALTENVSPKGGAGTLLRPREPADAVLEVPAGTIARWGWKVGLSVEVIPAEPH